MFLRLEAVKVYVKRTEQKKRKKLNYIKKSIYIESQMKAKR